MQCGDADARMGCNVAVLDGCLMAVKKKPRLLHRNDTGEVGPGCCANIG